MKSQSAQTHTHTYIFTPSSTVRRPPRTQILSLWRYTHPRTQTLLSTCTHTHTYMHTYSHLLALYGVPLALKFFLSGGTCTLELRLFSVYEFILI